MKKTNLSCVDLWFVADIRWYLKVDPNKLLQLQAPGDCTCKNLFPCLLTDLWLLREPNVYTTCNSLTSRLVPTQLTHMSQFFDFWDPHVRLHYFFSDGGLGVFYVNYLQFLALRLVRVTSWRESECSLGFRQKRGCYEKKPFNTIFFLFFPAQVSTTHQHPPNTWSSIQSGNSEAWKNYAPPHFSVWWARALDQGARVTFNLHDLHIYQEWRGNFYSSLQWTSIWEMDFVCIAWLSKGSVITKCSLWHSKKYSGIADEGTSRGRVTIYVLSMIGMFENEYQINGQFPLLNVLKNWPRKTFTNYKGRESHLIFVRGIMISTSPPRPCNSVTKKKKKN